MQSVLGKNRQIAPNDGFDYQTGENVKCILTSTAKEHCCWKSKREAIVAHLPRFDDLKAAMAATAERHDHCMSCLRISCAPCPNTLMPAILLKSKSDCPMPSTNARTQSGLRVSY